MFKKLLIVPLLFLGFIVGILSISAQQTVVQPPTPVPTLTPLISSVDAVAIPEVNLQPGAKSPHVKKVQEALKALGYLPKDLETTEYFGPQTREAIRKFQNATGLPATVFLVLQQETR